MRKLVGTGAFDSTADSQRGQQNDLAAIDREICVAVDTRTPAATYIPRKPIA